MTPEGVTRGAELTAILDALYRVGRVTTVAGLAWLVWQLATIVERAAAIYRTCGFVYYEVNEQLPRCMRTFIEERWWLDLVK